SCLRKLFFLPRKEAEKVSKSIIVVSFRGRVADYATPPREFVASALHLKRSDFLGYPPLKSLSVIVLLVSRKEEYFIIRRFS
ncbi:hypothetical protein WN51_10927, partial [Melipona quadrifasciata]